MAKRVKVKYRKLGKERAEGLYLNNTIEIDERLKGKSLFSALLHESLHHTIKTFTEEEILRIEKELVQIMWPQRERWIKKNAGGKV